MVCLASTHDIDTIRIKLYTRPCHRARARVVASGNEAGEGAFSGSNRQRRMAGQEDFILISVAARHLGMHPQTLRKYERMGLVQPTRTVGSMRVYSREELERLRLIKHLVEQSGINLAGVQRLLSIAEVVRRMQTLARGDALSRGQARRLADEIDRLIALVGL
jgi:MerR family transcriptional regulator, heat shock protein HspR